MNNIKLYALYNISEEGNPLMTITTTKEQARAYARSRLRITHATHFLSWCKSRGLNYEDESSWDRYMENCTPREELNSFRVKRLSFNKADITETLRIVTGCLPLGLSYESPAEYNKLAQLIEVYKENSSFIEQIKNMALFDKKVAQIIELLNVK